jgi:type IV secretory pathway VirB2 component (pilin)
MDKIAIFLKLFSVSALAQQEYPNPISATSILDLVTQIANTIRPIAITLGVIVIIITGFKFVTAAFSGKPDEITQARKAFFWALIGIAIVVSVTVVAPAIVDFIKSL